ncbi:DEAD-box helicase family protein, partial [Rhizoctonia solani AG-3 Rhs1AP]
QLANLKLEEGGDMVEHIADFCRMRSQLSGTRLAIDDQACISIEMKEFSALCARLTYLSQNPEPEAPVNDTPPPSAEDYTNWGVPGDIKAFGLTGDKNPLLEERAAVTCRDCLLKDHKAGTPECPQYEWRKELWGDLPKNENQSGMASNNNTRFIYEFSERTKVSLSFQELKLNESLIQSLNHAKLQGPHGVQQCAVLPAINGRNVIAQAPSETGKTTAIIICIAQLIDAFKKGVQALVISPTEQKATEIHSMVECVREQLRQLGYIYPYVPTNANSETYHELIRNFRAGSNNRQLITTYSVPLKRLLGAWGVSGDNFWIVNFNTPCSPQNYLERVNYLGICSGRNTAITLVDDGTDEINMIREIEQHFGIQMVELRWDGNSLL